MTEEILKIKAEELATIRLIFPDTKTDTGETVELTLKQARSYATKAKNEAGKHLGAILDALAYFSTKGVEPSLEFVISAKPTSVPIAENRC